MRPSIAPTLWARRLFVASSSARRTNTPSPRSHLSSPQTCGVGVGQDGLRRALHVHLVRVEKSPPDDEQAREAIALFCLPMEGVGGGAPLCSNDRTSTLWREAEVRCVW